MTSSNDPDDYVVRQAIIDGLWDGGDGSRVAALVAENKRLIDALIAMDEAVCHGSPETAKRIAREAYESLR